MLEIIPYGRLGNNIIQIINCITDNINYYKHTEINLKLLKNHQKEIFYNFPVIFNFDFSNNEEIIKDTFWGTKIKIPYDENIKIINEYIKPYIDYELQNTEISFDTDLIIHIRSGDVFDKSFPLDTYVQPPYSFYKRIIENNNFENIFIISENYNINPVIHKILNNFNNVRFLSNDLVTDFKICLNSKFFVNSNSTFSLIINTLSKDKLKIFVSQYTKGYHNFETTYIDLTEYYNLNAQSYYEKINNMLNF